MYVQILHVYTCICMYVNSDISVLYRPQSDKYPHNHCVYVESPTAPSSSTKDKSSLSPRLYYVFDPHLVLPEYYITVSYTSEKGEGGGGGEGENSEDDDDLIGMSPQPDSRPK